MGTCGVVYFGDFVFQNTFVHFGLLAVGMYGTKPLYQYVVCDDVLLSVNATDRHCFSLLFHQNNAVIYARGICSNLIQHLYMLS